jgi:hypothetical protein
MKSFHSSYTKLNAQLAKLSTLEKFTDKHWEREQLNMITTVNESENWRTKLDYKMNQI